MQPEEAHEPLPNVGTIETAQALIAERLTSVDELERNIDDVRAERDAVANEVVQDAPTRIVEDLPLPAVEVLSASRTDASEHSLGTVNDAIDEATVIRRQAAEVLNQSRIHAQHLLEDAERRGATTVGQFHDQAVQVLDEARDIAAATVQAAQLQADEIARNATARVDTMKEQAEATAQKAVADEREEYKAKATQITEAAIGDAQLLVTHAARQAQETMRAAASEADDMRAQASQEIAAARTAAAAKTRATDQLIAEKLGKAEAAAEAILERAHTEAAQAAKSILDEANDEAEALRQEAQQALATLEETKEQARVHVADAIRRATEDTATRTRNEIEAQLIDTRREIAMLEEKAATTLEKTKSDLARALNEAEEEANLIRARANVEVNATSG